MRYEVKLETFNRRDDGFIKEEEAKEFETKEEAYNYWESILFSNYTSAEEREQYQIKSIYDNELQDYIEQASTIVFILRDRETGNYIDERNTLSDAKDLLNEYEEEDKDEGTYTPDFYEIDDEYGNIVY